MTRAETAERLGPIKRRIAELWAAGMPSLAIAQETGITKNAVVGHAHRMHLPGRPSPIKRDGVRPSRHDRPIPAKLVPKLAELLSLPAQPIIVSVAPKPNVERTGAIAPRRAQERAPIPHREPAICCWPIGDPGTASFRWCTSDARAESPYCADHHRIAYVRAPRIAA